MVAPLSILDASGTTDTYFVRHSVSCDQRGALLRVLNEAVTMPLVAAIFMITYLLCGLPCWLDKRLFSLIYYAAIAYTASANAVHTVPSPFLLPAPLTRARAKHMSLLVV